MPHSSDLVYNVTPDVFEGIFKKVVSRRKKKCRCSVPFFFSASLPGACLHSGNVSLTVAGVTQQGGPRVRVYFIFTPPIFCGIRFRGEGGGSCHQKTDTLPLSLIPLLPPPRRSSLASSLRKHFPFRLEWRDRGGKEGEEWGYDTQQHVRTFGCSSSIGCFSLRSGGSPLAGVKKTALPLEETSGMRGSSQWVLASLKESVEPLPR